MARKKKKISFREYRENKIKQKNRDKQKSDGYFDGRFKTKTENHGKNYKRKDKYPKW